MQTVSWQKLLARAPHLFFYVMAAILLFKYIVYLIAVVPFPYDWEPTDGDHLNFAHRLAQGLPIYLPLREGQVLSIYNPLYHGLIAILGGGHVSLNFARFVAFVFWLMIPFSVFCFFWKRWGWYTIAAALFIWLPTQPYMLIDIVQVSPNSTVAFLFLVTLLFAISCVEMQDAAWWRWLMLGAIAACCYLAKQQGLIALVIVLSFQVLQCKTWRVIALTVLGFFVVFSICSAYLEYLNSGEYLRVTLLDLRKIITSDPHLAVLRLKEFLFDENLYFFACSIYSLYKSLADFKRLTIWQVSFLLHIPFLLAILGNGGGGPNYFLSMWISMVLLSIETVFKANVAKVSALGFFLAFLMITLWGKTSYIEFTDILILVVFIAFLVAYVDSKKAEKFAAIWSGLTWVAKYNWNLAEFFFITLIINFSLGVKPVLLEFEAISLPTPAMEVKMKDYYQSVKKLVADRREASILTNRNIGAFVFSNLRIANEGCTMFTYAWHSPSVFNKDKIINAIREKRFDFISTGIQDYPEDVRAEIEKYYRPALSKETNIYLGKMGVVNVFSPL